MRRREFIRLLGGAAAWPVAARAQQGAMPVVGFLSSGTPPATMLAALARGLQDGGFVERKNFVFVYRRADSDYADYRALATELLNSRAALILAIGGTPSALGAQSATTRVPIVFYIGGDPVERGLVRSLSRPDTNSTGVSFLSAALGEKRLELLRDLLPKATSIGMLTNPSNPDGEKENRDVQSAANTLAIDLRTARASSAAEFEPAFEALGQQRVGALLVGTDAFFNINRDRLIALAARHRLPAIYDRRDYVAAGGLISYGHDRVDAYHQIGVYAGRILKGEKPADLPVMQPTKFELVINRQTAKTLSLDIPPSLLALAD